MLDIHTSIATFHDSQGLAQHLAFAHSPIPSPSQYWQFLLFVVKLSFQESVYTFTSVCCENGWRMAKTTLLSNWTQHSISYNPCFVCLEPIDEFVNI